MTRWAFVSDIHGNRGALERAEARLRAMGADSFVCLGDVIGRGDPGGCVEWVRDTATIAVVGNRDLDYLERVPPDLQRVVRAWPHGSSASDFLVSHGDPKLHRPLNSSAERDGFARAAAHMTERGARAWFFGHTHRARIWEVRREGARLLSENTIPMDVGNQYVVNVGTTGLPLPGRGGASCVMYDDVTRTIQVIGLQAKRGPGSPDPSGVGGSGVIVRD